MINISKGDVVKIEFPFSDGVGSKIRPSLVISNDEVHDIGDVLVVQITSGPKSDDLPIPIEANDLDSPLPLKSYIRLHKIFVVERQMISGVISRLKADKYIEVISGINKIIG